jgi:predicted ester cyclase
MSTSELLLQWYEEVWNNANEEFIDQKMHKESIIHGLDPYGPIQGIEHFKSFYKNFRESFPQIRVTVQPLVSDEEYAAVYCKVFAKNISGKEVSFNGLSAVRMKDGMFVEAWNNFDFLKMYQQLGHILVEAEMGSSESGVRSRESGEELNS